MRRKKLTGDDNDDWLACLTCNDKEGHDKPTGSDNKKRHLASEKDGPAISDIATPMKKGANLPMLIHASKWRKQELELSRPEVARRRSR